MALSDKMIKFLKENKELLVEGNIFQLFIQQIGAYPNGPQSLTEDLLFFLTNSGISLDVIMEGLKDIPDYMFSFYNHPALPKDSILRNTVLDLSKYPIKRILLRAFECSDVFEVIFPKTLKYIGYKAFRDCDDLKKVILPEGLEEIEEEAFCYCRALKEVYIPDSCKKIGVYAFEGCQSLEVVSIPDSIPEDGLYKMYPSVNENCIFNIR